VGSWAQISDSELYRLLAELDYLPEADLKKSLTSATAENLSLYEWLLKHDVVSDQNLGKLIADSLKLPFISLVEIQIPEDVLRITPQAVAAQYGSITFGLDDRGLKIATTQPQTSDLFDMLAKKAGVRTYRLFYITNRDLEQALQLYRKQLSAAFDDLLATKKEAAAELPVAKIVDAVIEYAYVSRASDVHIEPTRAASVVRFRIDGVLHDVVRLPRTVHDQVVTRIKVLARLRTDEHFSAQDGRMHTKLQEESIDIRVSIVPIVAGEKIVLRLLASHFRQFGLTDLGMNEADLKKVQAAYSRPYGMVLSTGPTGSGKTTSMYAVLKILNVREKNIATIEDPVEYEIEGINQIQANTKTNLTFANGLRSILRQDPDIIYVGEIRDEETADIAINSAMTGHLVLSTLHTNDAATTLPRLIDMKIEPFLVSSTVNAIIGQRLVRRTCDRCKVSLELTHTADGWQGDTKTAAQFATLNKRLITQYFGSSGIVRLYRGKGCAVCHNTGYNGRVGIFEVLEVTPAIQTLITQKADAEQIVQQAVKDGMTTMMHDGLAKVAQGVTSIEEILRATTE
jgi:type II secretory ATPase GspE/PulE/Tfp pilus assembly ATPase PilB-like protein